MQIPHVEEPFSDDKTDYPPYPTPLRQGNVRDDDADVMDRMLQENPEPGLPYPNSPGELRPAPNIPATRLITGSMTLSQAPTDPAKPYRVLAADPRRIDLQLFATVVTGTVTYAPVYYASDGGSFLSGSTSAAVNAGKLDGPIALNCHTGELWIYYPTGPATDVQVSWIATTK
jgi:hypothetical protein